MKFCTVSGRDPVNRMSTCTLDPDEGPVCDCDIAARLESQGKGKSECPYWEEITEGEKS